MGLATGTHRRWFRWMCLVLAFLQAVSLTAQQSGSNPAPSMSDTAKIAHQVSKVRIGGKLTVSMLDGKKYHGHLLVATDKDLTFDEVDLHQKITVPYSDVKHVSRNYGGKTIHGGRANPISTPIAIGAMIGVLVFVIIAAARDKS